MAWIDRRLRQAGAHQETPFGGYPFAQLPPVGDRPLYAADHADSDGFVLYHLFDKVVILNELVSKYGTDPQQIQFRNLLMRLRNGDTTEDWKLLLSRAASNTAVFNHVVHLFYHKDKVVQDKLNSPIAHINAKHSCSIAATADSDDAGRLEPVLFIAKGAKVMLTSDLWQQKGLCNGATGVVRDILYAADDKPPLLPIALLIQFHEFTGPPFLAG